MNTSKTLKKRNKPERYEDVRIAPVGHGDYSTTKAKNAQQINNVFRLPSKGVRKEVPSVDLQLMITTMKK